MNKTILLTGAGGVLCGKLAEALSEKGHKIAVLDISKEAAGAVVERIKSNGGNAIGLEANVLEKDTLISARKVINNSFGKIDILINAAGMQVPIGSLNDISAEAWIKTIELNLIGTML